MDISNPINEALAQAKASGAFDGADGNTPVRGTDYWTPADQEAIVQQVIAALGTPVFGRVDAGNNIILTGELTDGTYTLKYEDAEGNVTEIGDIIIGEAGRPIGVNMIPLSVNADGTPFVGTNGEAGYKSGWRLNSAGGEIAQENLFCTGFMPVETGDTISLHNVGWSANQSDNYLCNLVLYDEQFQKIGNASADKFKASAPEIEGVVSGGRFSRYDVGDGATSYTHLVGFQIDVAGAKYLRLGAYFLSATSSVMVAEP